MPAEALHKDPGPLIHSEPPEGAPQGKSISDNGDELTLTDGISVTDHTSHCSVEKTGDSMQLHIENKGQYFLKRTARTAVIVNVSFNNNNF